MKRVLGLIALVLFPVWLLSLLLFPGVPNYEESTTERIRLVIVLLVLSFSYIYPAARWWLNPSRTPKYMKVFVVAAQIVAFLALMIFGVMGGAT